MYIYIYVARGWNRMDQHKLASGERWRIGFTNGVGCKYQPLSKLPRDGERTTIGYSIAHHDIPDNLNKASERCFSYSSLIWLREWVQYTVPLLTSICPIYVSKSPVFLERNDISNNARNFSRPIYVWSALYVDFCENETRARNMKSSEKYIQICNILIEKYWIGIRLSTSLRLIGGNCLKLLCSKEYNANKHYAELKIWTPKVIASFVILQK